MKYLILMLSILVLYSCHSHVAKNTTEYKSQKEIEIQTANNGEEADEFCDTAKIRDFIKNLTIIDKELTDKLREYQDNQAKEFIVRACELDSLYCGDHELKISKIYSYNKEWELLLTGYILGDGKGMEANSASFFVLTILRNNEPWYTDIIEDLMGEIQMELTGFEDKDRQVTVWGYAYPFFNEKYGKFRLQIRNGVTDYEYQCKSQH